MNIRDCEYIIAIADEGNLSRAAKKLGITQPSLSVFLKQLESNLDLELFTYTNQTMLPTEAGKIYISFCRKVIFIKKFTYQNIYPELYNEDTLRVGVSLNNGSKLFEKIYPKFYPHFPEVKIELKEGYTTELIDLLNQNELDLIIGSVGHINADLNYVVSSQENIYLSLPNFHPLAKKVLLDNQKDFSTIDINELEDTPFVMWDNKTTISQTLHRFFLEKEFSPTIVYKSNNSFLINSMLSSGIGAGFIPESYCTPSSSRVYFKLDSPIFYTHGIMFLKSNPLTRAQRYFIYLLIKAEEDKYNLLSKELKALCRNFFEEFEGVII